MAPPTNPWETRGDNEGQRGIIPVKHIVTRVGKVEEGSRVLLKVALIPDRDVWTSEFCFAHFAVKVKSRRVRRRGISSEKLVHMEVTASATE